MPSLTLPPSLSFISLQDLAGSSRMEPRGTVKAMASVGDKVRYDNLSFARIILTTSRVDTCQICSAVRLI